MKHLFGEALRMVEDLFESADGALSKTRWSGWIKLVIVVVWFFASNWLATTLFSAILSPLRIIDPSERLYFALSPCLNVLMCGCLRIPLFVIPIVLYIRWKRKQAAGEQQDDQDGQ